MATAVHFFHMRHVVKYSRLYLYAACIKRILWALFVHRLSDVSQSDITVMSSLSMTVRDSPFRLGGSWTASLRAEGTADVNCQNWSVCVLLCTTLHYVVQSTKSREGFVKQQIQQLLLSHIYFLQTFKQNIPSYIPHDTWHSHKIKSHFYRYIFP